MVFYTTLQAMYFTLLSNLENKAALKTTSEFFGKKNGNQNVYNYTCKLLYL